MTERKNGVELLPCPFCGSSNVQFIAGLVRQSVFCNSCNTSGPTGNTKTGTKNQSIKAWNTRKHPAKEVEVSKIRQIIFKTWDDVKNLTYGDMVGKLADAIHAEITGGKDTNEK